MADTELKLIHWRGDQIGAERLAAAILHIDGFASVDPQCPLGGPDGLKDLICEKNGWRYVAAAYFPNSELKFKTTRDKFAGDLQGVSDNSTDGIVFISNQPLTPGERDELVAIADGSNHKAMIYHRERIRALLDSPAGYGARLEYLNIGMTLEEQSSFVAARDASFEASLRRHTTQIIDQLSRRFDNLEEATSALRKQLHEVDHAVQQTLGLVATVRPSDKSAIACKSPLPLDRLNTDVICGAHGALMFDTGTAETAGRLRDRDVWIGTPGTPREAATFSPPPPDRVAIELEQLLVDWTTIYPGLRAESESAVVSKISDFHARFLRIHPFADGNGRIARLLLAAQARDLLHQGRRVVLDDTAAYATALTAAHTGDPKPLERLIAQALLGQEVVAGSPCQMSGQRCPGCKSGTLNVASGETGVSCEACGLFIPA